MADITIYVSGAMEVRTTTGTVTAPTVTAGTPAPSYSVAVVKR